VEEDLIMAPNLLLYQLLVVALVLIWVAYPGLADNSIDSLLSRLIHAAANFVSFFVFRGLSINESTFWRMDW
jgi:hypothetical protein